jgi:hypothetical protein
MALDQFIYTKTILIDDAGWGDLILGAVIGALKLPDHKYMERRIPVIAFQQPNFENKSYLEEAVRIAREIVDVMQADQQTCFKVCSGFILSRVRSYLQEQGFHVEKMVITGELQEMVEKSFVDWCVEVGVPKDRLENKRRFYPILDWVADMFELREHLVKTGWKSWHNKWRQKAQEIHLQKIVQSQRNP